MVLVKEAVEIDSKSRDRLTSKMQDMTNLDNPNSVQQMKMWLSDNGMEMESLGKKEVAAAIKTAPQDIIDVLSLRQQLAKSSVKKYTAMENAVCKDNRARGMFQFYGANRTGRFAGRLIQLRKIWQKLVVLCVAEIMMPWNFYMKISQILCLSLSVLPLCRRRTENLS